MRSRTDPGRAVGLAIETTRKVLYKIMSRAISSWPRHTSIAFLLSAMLHVDKNFVAGSQHASDTFPNIGYLGAGYDIFFGSPQPISAATDGPDPGFRHSVFDVTAYTEHQTTADGSFSVPDGVEVVSCNRCSIDFVTEVVRGTTSYTSSSEAKVEFDASGFGAAFKASMDYKTVTSSTSEEHSVFLKTGAECCEYSATIEAYNAPQLSSNFRNAVGAMNYPYDGDDAVSRGSFHLFIHEFGTHVVTKLSMGARFGLVSRMTDNDYSSLLSRHVNFGVTASAKMFGVGVGENQELAVESREEIVFSGATTSEHRYQVGAAMPRLNNNAPDLTAWTNAVKEDPMPLKTVLVAIDTLLTAQNFEDLQDISQKQIALRDALADYCNTLVVNAKLDNCDLPGPDPPPPPLPAFGGIYQTNVDIPNPFTGGQSCPQEYTALFGGLLWNENERDTNDLYYCWRSNLVHQIGSDPVQTIDPDPLQMFGGMWRQNEEGVHGDGCEGELGNALDNLARSCSAAFTKVQIGWVKTGKGGHWGCVLYACLNLDMPLTQNLIGGFFQVEDSCDSCHGSGTDNSYTHSMNCPDGFLPHRFGRTITGNYWTGTNLFVCLDELWVPANSGH